MQRPYIILILLASAFFAIRENAARANTEGGTLELQDYLAQVQKNHQGLQGALLERDGSELISEGSQLPVTPNLFANVSLLNDDKLDPLFGTTSSVHNSYSLGVSEMTTFGTQAKLSYNLDYSEFIFAPSAGRPNLNYNQGRPTLEITQSLWRNGFGSETRAQLQSARSAAMANSYANSYQARVILSQAESGYWTLSLTRGAVRVAKDVLERAQKLYDWSARRVALHLADEADRIQAEALLKLRKLDYQQALDNQRNASRNLNQLRGEDSDVVAEQVTPLGSPSISVEAPMRAGVRLDVQSAQEQQQAAIANSQLGKEKTKPTLDLFAQASFNGSDQNLTPTISTSFTTDQPTIAGGVRFTMPLDFGLVKDAQRGYALEEESAERLYQRRFFEQENDWADLNQKLGEAKQRYELSRTVEQIENEKLRVERERLNRGKTTTFNVIQFEQDAAQSELNALRAQSDVLQIIAQMKTFGGPL